MPARARPLRCVFAALAACASLAAGCARIEPITSPYLERYAELARAPRKPPQPGPPVFISGEYVVGHKQGAGITALLHERIAARLKEQGFVVVHAEEEAKYRLTCSVRGWWAYGGKTALINLLTLGVYAPFYYPWVVEVNVYNPKGGAVADVYEKGRINLHCFGTILLYIPPAITYAVALPPRWHDLADNAGRIATAKLCAIEGAASQTPPPAQASHPGSPPEKESPP